VRAEYERALTLAKQQIGPLPTTSEFVNRYRWLLRHDPGSSRRKPRRATRSGLGSCLPPSSRPRQPNIWYATAADALHRGEPFGHVT